VAQLKLARCPSCPV